MTQRDAIFERLQVMTTGRAAYVCTPNIRSNFDLTKPKELILASASCLAGANPFTDQLVRAPSLMGTGLYLNRVSSSVERYGNYFALTNVYRVNWSRSRNWSGRRDPLYATQSELQSLSNQLTRIPEHDRSDFSLSSDQLHTLESILQSVTIRPKGEQDTDHYHVSCTLIGEITDELKFQRRCNSYHYTFTYSYDLPYEMVGYRAVDDYTVKMRLGVSHYNTPIMTSGGAFLDAYFQLHMCGPEDIVIEEDETLNRVRLFQRHQPEEVYRDWLPKPETLSLAFDKPGGLSLYRRTDLQPDVKPVKKLEDMIAGDMLNVPIRIEMFDTLESSSHKLEPGVYQFLLQEEPYFEGNMFDYSIAASNELSRYRVVLPSGWMAAITPSSEEQVVTRANISRRELSLPQDTEIKSSHQINKNF